MYLTNRLLALLWWVLGRGRVWKHVRHERSDDRAGLGDCVGVGRGRVRNRVGLLGLRVRGGGDQVAERGRDVWLAGLAEERGLALGDVDVGEPAVVVHGRLVGAAAAVLGRKPLARVVVLRRQEVVPALGEEMRVALVRLRGRSARVRGRVGDVDLVAAAQRVVAVRVLWLVLVREDESVVCKRAQLGSQTLVHAQRAALCLAVQERSERRELVV